MLQAPATKDQCAHTHLNLQNISVGCVYCDSPLYVRLGSAMGAHKKFSVWLWTACATFIQTNLYVYVSLHFLADKAHQSNLRKTAVLKPPTAKTKTSKSPNVLEKINGPH